MIDKEDKISLWNDVIINEEEEEETNMVILDDTELPVDAVRAGVVNKKPEEEETQFYYEKDGFPEGDDEGAIFICDN
jgi:hypothetical protein